MLRRKAAVKEMGIVPGGGSVLLYLSSGKFVEAVQKAAAVIDVASACSVAA